MIDASLASLRAVATPAPRRGSDPLDGMPPKPRRGPFGCGLAQWRHQDLQQQGIKGGNGGGDWEKVIRAGRAKTASASIISPSATGTRGAGRSIAEPSYSGTLSQTVTRSVTAGQVLHVQSSAPGTEPRSRNITTARYDWPVIEAHVARDGVDAVIRTDRTDNHRSVPRTATQTRQINLSGEIEPSRRWVLRRALSHSLKGRCADLSVGGNRRRAKDCPPRIGAAFDAQWLCARAAEALQARREE